MAETGKLNGRPHPIRTAALLGGLVGFLVAVTIEVKGLLHPNSPSGVLILLWPAATAGAGVSQESLLQTGFILIIEIVANVLVYALLFAAPVALVVALLRTFRRRGSQPLP
ncbi:MAG TPA: hypothetical protein VK764_03415 [Terracidiphilus sp.]|jgi:hypothetical protein|nr:hypothetical protein [Terracidiphilus sp.]